MVEIVKTKQKKELYSISQLEEFWLIQTQYNHNEDDYGLVLKVHVDNEDENAVDKVDIYWIQDDLKISYYVDLDHNKILFSRYRGEITLIF